MQLEIQNLSVLVDNKKILDNLNLKINKGEIHAIMGPNGVGKSTLSKIIMGYPNYNIESGDILVNSNSILKLEINERSKLGIFLVYQNPISIEGVLNRELIKASLDANDISYKSFYEYVLELDKNIQKLDMQKDMAHRSFNVGFSGGEKKKNEILQLLMLKPKFIILDELDSGLDVDSLKVVCDAINDYLKENPTTSVLIITHYTRILEYIKPNYVHVLKDGNIIKSGDYNLAKLIEKDGYNQSFSVGE
ncbi:MAG: Fe-S cluster assembly ATPase SufC [Bacilli bacterium]|nr:Fe-S cluster assembly ATPase SufC [Bacilli bacterium]